jgi:ankyrin repeat protein
MRWIMADKIYEKCIRLMRQRKKKEVLEMVVHHPYLCHAIENDLCLVSQAAVNKLGFRFLTQLLDAGVSPNVSDSSGGTPLIDASSRGDCAVVRLLLEKGAKVNHQTYDGESAFSFACANNCIRCAKLLHSFGADVNLNVGRPPSSTPLDWAVRYGSKGLANWLKGVGGRRFEEESG